MNKVCGRTVFSFILMISVNFLGMILLYPVLKYFSLDSHWMIFYGAVLGLIPYLVYTSFFVLWIQQIYREILPSVNGVTRQLFWGILIIPLHSLLMLCPAWKKRNAVRLGAVALPVMIVLIFICCGFNMNPGIIYLLGVCAGVVNLWLIFELSENKCNMKFAKAAGCLVLVYVVYIVAAGIQITVIDHRWEATANRLLAQGIPVDRLSHKEMFENEPVNDHGLAKCLKQLRDAEMDIRWENITDWEKEKKRSELAVSPVMLAIDKILDDDFGKIIFEKNTGPLMERGFSGVIHFREAMRYYSLRIKLAADSRDLQSVMTDFRRTHRIIRIFADNADLLIPNLTASACVAIQLEALGEVLAYGILDEAARVEISGILQDEANLLYKSFAVGIKCEAAVNMDMADVLLEGAGEVVDVAWKRFAVRMPFYGILIDDKIMMAEFWSKFYKECIESGLEPYQIPAERTYFPDRRNNYPPNSLAYDLMTGTTYNLHHTMYKCEARLRAAQIALFPEKINTLTDPFSGEPFRKIDGEFTIVVDKKDQTVNGIRIYSIGPDRKDERGIEDSYTRRDDISFDVISL